MNRFTSIVAVTFLSVVAIVMCVHACEQTTTTDTSWDECESPASALSLSFGPDKNFTREFEEPGPRLLVRSRHDTYLDFHLQNVNQFRPLLPGWRSNSRRRFMTDDASIGTTFVSWYRVETPNSVLMQPRRFLLNMEYQSTIPGFVVTTDPYMQFANDDIRWPTGDAANRFQEWNSYRRTSEVVVDSLRPQLRTEWKLVRRAQIDHPLRPRVAGEPWSAGFEVRETGCSYQTKPDEFEMRALNRLYSNCQLAVVYNETEDEIRIVAAFGQSAISYRLVRVEEGMASVSYGGDGNFEATH